MNECLKLAMFVKVLTHSGAELYSSVESLHYSCELRTGNTISQIIHATMYDQSVYSLLLLFNG